MPKRRAEPATNPNATPSKRCRQDATPSSKAGRRYAGAPALKRKDSFEPTTSSEQSGAAMGNSGAELPHTLICGTFPSEVSFAAGSYFANRMNAFWWIFGDAFGHRRATARAQPPASIQPLREAPLRSYAEQMEELTRRGFVVWDVCKACKREGSLDVNIKADSVVPNDIEGFCRQHPTIKRICLASGKSTGAMFLRHNKSWLARTGPVSLVLADNDATLDIFGQKKLRHLLPGTSSATGSDSRITLAVMYSVSPAACNPKYPGGTYAQKREQWLRDCWHAKNTALQPTPGGLAGGKDAESC